MKSSALAANIVCIKSVKTAVKSLSLRQRYSKCWNMFVLNMLAANASKLRTTAALFKSQRRKALSRRASPQKACWPISSSANTNTRCHFIDKSRCLPSRVSNSHEPRWQGGLSKSVRSSPRFTRP